MCVDVVSSILDAGPYLTVNVGTPAQVTQEECQHKSFFPSHFIFSTFLLRRLPFFFTARGVQQALSLVDRRLEFLCTHDMVALHRWYPTLRDSRIRGCQPSHRGDRPDILLRESIALFILMRESIALRSARQSACTETPAILTQFPSEKDPD